MRAESGILPLVLTGKYMSDEPIPWSAIGNLPQTLLARAFGPLPLIWYVWSHITLFRPV